MTRQELDVYLAYNRWANRRLLQAAAALSADQFSKDLRASFGSVRGTLLHILWGEAGWLHYWKESAFIPEFALQDFPTIAAVEARWSELEDAQRAYVESVTDEALMEQRSVDGYVYTLGELIQQTLTHSVHHRGQVVLLLRQLGHTPPDTDFRSFLTGSRYRAI